MDEERTELKKYMNDLLSKGLREDKRKLNDFRKIEIEENVISQANGSARVRLGETDVMVGIKMDVGEPYPDSPDSGVLITSAELHPIASEKFEEGPPRENAIEFARVVDRAVRESDMINFDKLCIKKGEKVWIVFLDILPLNDAGNLFDAAVIGANIALKNAVMPKYDAKKDLIDHRTLTKEKVPLNDSTILCTFGKIGENLFLDPDYREGSVIDNRLSIGINKKGDICAMQKGEIGTMTEKEVMSMVDIAIKKSEELRKQLKI